MKKLLLVATILAFIGLAFAVGQLTGRGPAVYADGPPQTFLATTNEAANAESVVKRTEVTIPVVPHPIVDRIQWEYKAVQTNVGDLPGGQLDQLGNEGWEMCGVHQRGQLVSTYYFKREKAPGANPGNQPAVAPTISQWGGEPAISVIHRPAQPPATFQSVPSLDGPPANQPAPTPSTYRIEPFRDAPTIPTVPSRNAEPANEPAITPVDPAESIMKRQLAPPSVPTEPRAIEAK